MGFTKLDSGIIHSSIWSEPISTRIVWITMLAMSDADGFVSCSLPGLIRASNIPEEDVLNALDSFLKPDKYSRTKEFDGRRIEETDGGWIILNYTKYREYSKTDYLREKQKRYRDKKCIDTVSILSASASDSLSVSVLEKKEEVQEKKEKPFIPDHLQDIWQDFMEMRRAIRKPATKRAQELIIQSLIKLYPNDTDMQRESLLQSIENSWQGVFHIKSKSEVKQSAKHFGRQEISMDELIRQAEEIKLS